MDQKIEQSNLNWAKERSAELLAGYDQLKNEKITRDEEFALQDKMNKQ